MPAPTPTAQLSAFINRFTPEVAACTRAVLKAMRRHVPGATELVYDNYNALAIGFAPGERTSEVVMSVAAYPRWVSLFFFNGTSLPDPERLLKGTGSAIRHIVLDDARDLDRPAMRALMRAALAAADPPIDPAAKRRLIIKSVSAKQRPRRPARA
jgi:hypothetical protein